MIGNAMLVRNSQAANLALTDSVKVMDMQVLIAFAFGVPHHGHFDRLNLVCGNSPNLPFGRQLAAGFVNTVFTT